MNSYMQDQIDYAKRAEASRLRQPVKLEKVYLKPREDHFRRVRAICSDLAPRTSISTRDLVDKCWPGAVEPAYTLRQELYALLTHHPEEIADCWTRGAPVKNPYSKKKTARPYLWHAPRDICPHCAGSGYLLPIVRGAVTHGTRFPAQTWSEFDLLAPAEKDAFDWRVLLHWARLTPADLESFKSERERRFDATEEVWSA